MLAYLKIKIKSLAAEAGIIRSEENKRKELKLKIKALAAKATDTNKQEQLAKREKDRSRTLFGLYYHRVHELRRESRSALLAYGYLRGRRYRQIEAKCYTQPDWNRIRQLIYKFGGPAVEDPKTIGQSLDRWRNGN